MEDAGFILGSYIVTFGGVAAYALYVVRRGPPRGRRRCPTTPSPGREARFSDVSTIDLTPRTDTGAPAAPASAGAWAPLVVLALVLVAGGVIVTQFLALGRRLLLQRRRGRLALGCEAGRRLRVQGTVDEGDGRRRTTAMTDFTIASTARRCRCATAGSRGASSRSASPSSCTASWSTARSQGDHVEVKHSNEYDGGRTRTGSTRMRPTESDDVLAASLNGALGRAGLVLSLAAATFGRDGDDLRHPPPRHPHRCGMAPRYAWLCVAGAVLSLR